MTKLTDRPSQSSLTLTWEQNQQLTVSWRCRPRSRGAHRTLPAEHATCHDVDQVPGCWRCLSQIQHTASQHWNVAAAQTGVSCSMASSRNLRYCTHKVAFNVTQGHQRRLLLFAKQSIVEASLPWHRVNGNVCKQTRGMSFTSISARINNKIQLQYHSYQYWIYANNTKSFHHLWCHIVDGASKL